VLVFLAEATILSTILSYIIVYVGLEVILDFFFPVYISIPFPFNLCGLLISVLGFMLIVWANYTLLFVGRIGLKNREPFHIPHKLILEGPYKFSIAIFLGSLTLFIISIALFIIFRIFFIRWEEKKLEEAFGEEYLEYKRRVRRWI
jgi:protein-S-isoprenylcysteine O-methyltransferase Ste14